MSEIRYTKDHEWVRREGDTVTVGITDHAQAALGDIVFAELPKAGRKVSPGEAIAVVESVKAASDVYAPLAGEIVGANAALNDDPALINRAPESDGWFFQIKLADPAQFDALLDAQAYKSLVEGA